MVRAWILAAVTLVTWLTAASPARADGTRYAPLCDDRGASALAPPPTFEASDIAIRRTAASCNPDKQSLSASIRSGRSRPPWSSPSAEPALPPSLAGGPHPGSQRLASSPAETGDRHGV